MSFSLTHHAALVATLGIAAAGCGEGAEAQAPDFRPQTATAVDGGALRILAESMPFVVVEEVGADAVDTLIRAPGLVAFREGAVSEVGAPVDGRVTAVHAQVGQRVAEGDPLVTIASPSAAQLRGDLARARVMRRAAETELARQEQLAARGVGIESDRVRAEASLAEARAMLSALTATSGSIGRGAAASVTVRSPISGTVLVRRASLGAAVDSGGEPLLVIGEPDALWVQAQVFERELPLIEVGAEARVSIHALGEPVTARVEAVGGAVDAETRRAPVYLSFTDALGGRLRAGMYARAEIEAGEAGLGIPTSSVLIKDGGRTVVFVARDPRTFEAREVQVGAAVGGRVPVLSGLERGEQLVTRGALLLDGQAELLR